MNLKNVLQAEGLLYPDIPPKGWVCPKCGRVYAPFTPMCLYCGGEESVSISTTTGTPPEWGDRSWAFNGGASMDEEENE